MQHDNEAPDASTPRELTPAQTYANLCAQLGERHYLATKLMLEAAEIVKKLDALGLKNPEPQT